MRWPVVTLVALAWGCTLVRKQQGNVEVVLPLQSCIDADNVTLFRQFTWDYVGGKRTVWPYVGSPYPPGSYDVSTWAAVAAQDTIKLNFGGGADKHPRTYFVGYVAIEALDRKEQTMGGHCSSAFPSCGSYCVCYDPSGPIPLANNSVAQILCEHVFEHIPAAELPGLLVEFHRVLRPGGWVRIAVPDYGHPRQIKFMEEGLRLGQPDSTNRRHITFTNYAMMRDLAFASPFGGGIFYEFWDDIGGAVHHVSLPLSFKMGLVKRSSIHNAHHRRSGGRPRPSRSTSVVFDLVKREPSGNTREKLPDTNHMLRYYEHPSFGLGRKRRGAYLRAEQKKRSASMTGIRDGHFA